MLDKFTTADEMQAAYEALHEYKSNEDNKRYTYPAWCDCIGLEKNNQSMLSNFMKGKGKVQLGWKWFLTSLECFNLEADCINGLYVFHKKEKKEKKEESTPDPNPFTGSHLAGLYKGLFIRHSQMELAEMYLLLLPTGDAKFMTNTNKQTIYKGAFTYDAKHSLLIGVFNEQSNNLYHFNFYLKVPVTYTNNKNSSQPIDGTYSGILNIHNYRPISGLLRLRLETAWTGNIHSDDLNKLFDAKAPVGHSLININEPFPNVNLEKYLDDIYFFMGYRWTNEDGRFIVDNEIISDSVDFLKKIKFVQRFDIYASAFSGTYMVYSLATTRTKFIGRPLMITPDGRAYIIMLNEDKTIYYYQGRAHFFDDFLSISIDRKIEMLDDSSSNTEEKELKHIEKTHRSLYTFEVRQVPFKKIKHIFGVSNIITSQTSLRVGEEVIVKSDLPFTEMQPFSYPINSLEFEALNENEKQVYEYLKTGYVWKVDRIPNDSFERTNESFVI